MTSIIAHGAIFDGDPANATINAVAWRNAITAAQTSDRIIECPPGRCVVADDDGDTQAIAVENIGVSIFAPDRRATELALAPGQNAHLMSFKNTVGGGLFNISLDGDRLNQNAGHCIRGEDVDDLTIRSVLTRNAFHYCAGFQAGVIRDLDIIDLIAEDCGGDAIDIKNKLNGNRGNILRRIRVRRFGLNVADQAAVDVRGPCDLHGIIIDDLASGHSGIRFRNGELSDPNGVGGHRSILSHFQIYGISQVASLGVSDVARSVSISNGYIEGVLRGIQVQQELARVSNVEAADCIDGFYAAAAGVPTHGDDASFDTCIATACVKGFRSNRPRTMISGCTARSCGTSIYAGPDATLMRLIGGKSVSPTAAHKGGTLANITSTGFWEV